MWFFRSSHPDENTFEKTSGDSWTLNSEGRIGVAAIEKLQDIVASGQAPSAMSLQPREIFIDLRCVDNEQKLLCIGPVEDQIVDDPAALIEHQRILRLANIKGRHSIREQRVEPFRRFRAPDQELAHVRDIENPAMLPHRSVFIEDARVLNRHLPPGKIHHPSAGGKMSVVKRRAPTHRFLFWSSKFK